MTFKLFHLIRSNPGLLTLPPATYLGAVGYTPDPVLVEAASTSQHTPHQADHPLDPNNAYLHSL